MGHPVEDFVRGLSPAQLLARQRFLRHAIGHVTAENDGGNSFNKMPPPRPKTGPRRRGPTPETIRKIEMIMEARAGGATHKQMMERFGISKTHLSRLIRAGREMGLS